MINLHQQIRSSQVLFLPSGSSKLAVSGAYTVLEWCSIAKYDPRMATFAFTLGVTSLTFHRFIKRTERRRSLASMRPFS